MSEKLQEIYDFHNFQIDVGKGVLLRENQPVSMQWKTFELLCIFARSNGNLLTRDELMNELWADTFVEDNNLSQHIRALRKALGENGKKFIETVPGRGYRFLAEVKEISGSGTSAGIKLNNKSAETNGFLKTETDEQTPAYSNIENNYSIVPQINLDGTKPISIFKKAKFRTAAIFVVLSVIVLGAVFLWQKQKSENSLPADDKTAQFLNFSSVKYQKIVENQTGASAISPDGRFIVYTNMIGGKQTLWLRQLASNTNIQILPPTEVGYYRLSFSRDSEYIYFDHKNTLYRVSVLGGATTPIMKEIEGFSLSPDDTQIVFFRRLPDYRCGLFVSNADGSAERIIAERQSPDCYKTVAWSPDGKLIAFAAGQSNTGDANTRLLAHRIADETEISLSEERWYHIHNLVWLPGRSSIILSGRKKLGEENPLWQINYPSGKTRQLTDGLLRYVYLSLTADGNRLLASQVVLNSYLSIAPADAPSEFSKLDSAFYGMTWLPDGKIVYSSHINKNSLWLINSDGTEQKQLTFDDAGYLNPVASPDGRYIYFTLTGNSVHHIWRMNADGSDKIQLTDGTGEQKPNVSPDGQWLFYQVAGKSPTTIWKVSTDGGEPIQVTTGHDTNPSVSPDGKLLAFFRRKEPSEDILEMVAVSLKNGQIVRKFSLPEGDLIATFKILWTKDGKALIYAKEKLDRIANIWTQPLNGSQPKQITNYSSERIFDFGWSPDGKQLAVIRGAWKNEAVLISGFR